MAVHASFSPNIQADLGGIFFLAEQYKQTHHQCAVLKVEAISKHMLCWSIETCTVCNHSRHPFQMCTHTCWPQHLPVFPENCSSEQSSALTVTLHFKYCQVCMWIHSILPCGILVLHKNLKQSSMHQQSSKHQTSCKNSTKTREVFFFYFEPFICCLSVVLWLDKGDFPQNVHAVSVLK